MQNPKPRPSSLDVPHKQSLTTRTSRKLKTHGSDPESSPNITGKSPNKSTKVADRKATRVLAVEKKRSGKLSELESQIIQLQEELKKAKHQLSLSEPWKSAQQEAEDAKKQLAVVTRELVATKKELKELCECEDSRVQELRKISQDRDRAWQSELEAVQKQHELDTAALASAINEMLKLKNQLDRAYQSEASHARHAESAHAEIHSLRIELTETLVLVEKLKTQLNDCRESEVRVTEEVTTAQRQLEMLKAAEKTLQEERATAVEAYNILLLELEQSKNKVNSLEELVGNLQSDQGNRNKSAAYPLVEGKTKTENGECDETKILKIELSSMKNEVNRLRAALESAERNAKLESSSHRAAELEAKLEDSTTEIEELRSKLFEKEKALQSISCENNGLNLEKTKSDSVLEDLKVHLLDTEVQLQTVIEENNSLKSKMMTSEKERSKENEEARASAEAARAAEHEASVKIGSLTEEANRSFREAARVTEQLDAAQAANIDMEAELRRLKVQCNQWRKAAEAATAMLSTGDHVKYVEKTSFFDFRTTSTKLSSPQYEDSDDDESGKKRNGNMLKRIGVLLKKGQK